MKIAKMLKDVNKRYVNNLFAYKDFKAMIHSNFTVEEEDSFKFKLKEEILKTFTFINDNHVNLISKAEAADGSDEHECENIKIEIYDFSEFIRINLIAIKRIISRHDKYTGYSLMGEYKKKIKEKTYETKNLLSLIQTVNMKIVQRVDKDRKSSKYWIPSENLVNLKLGILKHLPKATYVNDANRLDDSCITSIYLDNTDFALYNMFNEQKESSFFIRLRWYGTRNTIVSCEMSSIKNFQPIIKSFNIPAKLVLKFLNGNDIWDQIKEENLTEAHEVFAEIQQKIKKYRLRPVIRTFFRRSIFENPKSPGLKINLDTNIVMVKECSNYDFENDIFPLNSWCRNDIAYDWPFRNLSGSEIVRFPNSVLEVIQEEETDVSWLENLLSMSKIEKIENFSKFIHGTALIFPFNSLLPNWLPRNGFDYKSPNNDAIKRKDVNEELLQIQGESEISYNFSPINDEGHTVAIPVRVEPKVFFANERTFLSWVQFAIFLGGIGSAMIGLGNFHAYLCGVLLIGVAGLFAFYSLYLYHYRATRIRVKDPGPYDDDIGPTVLVGIFIFVMALAFTFKFPIKKNGLKSD